MRYGVTVLCTVLLTSLVISGFRDCLADDKDAPPARTYSDRSKIVVLPADKNKLQVAPGEYVAVAGTQYHSNQWKWDAANQNWTLEIKSDKVAPAVIVRTVRWGVTKDPRTWPLLGVCALKKFTCKIVLSPQGGGSRRTITVTVKKHPKDWEEKLLTKLKDKKVSYQFKDADFETFAAILAKKTKLRIMPDYFSPEAKEKKITYTATREPVIKVLENALKKAGLDWVLTNNRVLITKPVVVEIVKLDYLLDCSLNWLAAHQSADGSFSSAKFMDNCPGDAKCTGAGDSDRDITLTGLAVLAFVGNGYTQNTGRYKTTVSKAKDYLIKHQKADGSFGEMKGELAMLDTYLAANAICELYAVTRDRRLKAPSGKAVEFLLKAQQQDGAWSWDKTGGKSNTITTCLAVLALKTAKTGGLQIPKEAFDNAVKFLESVTDEGGRAGYQAKGDKAQPVGEDGGMPTSTAASVIASIFCGISRKDPRILKGINIVGSGPPVWDKSAAKVDPLYWYLGFYSVFQYGRKPWQNWRPKMIEALVDNQQGKGCAAGSWKPCGRWEKFGGRMFFTTLNTLTAEIAFRYLRAQEILKYE